MRPVLMKSQPLVGKSFGYQTKAICMCRRGMRFGERMCLMSRNMHSAYGRISFRGRYRVMPSGPHKSSKPCLQICLLCEVEQHTNARFEESKESEVANS